MMTVQQLFNLFLDFKNNEFNHALSQITEMRARVDKVYNWNVRLFIGLIFILVGVILGIVLK